LADFKPFQIVLLKLAVWIVYGQCYESTSVSALSPGALCTEIAR